MSSDEPARSTGRQARGSGWLELLLTGATAADLDSHRTMLLAGCAPDEQAAVEAQAAQARRLSELLRDQRRHAEELSVLNDLARSLSTLRDPTQTLSDVAAQARRLLAVDVAYIMLLRADEKLRIETIDGSLGSSMRGIELARGEGLGGRVLDSGEPLWTANYTLDQSFSHLGSLDSAASSEQLGGILGVPLILGHQTIGVLLAAHRSPREFAPREVALLAALASHAAISIRNSELYEQARTSAIELATSNEQLRVSGERSERSVELHGRLTDVVLRGGGLAHVAAALEPAVDAHITVFDERDQWAAAGSGAAPTDLGMPEPVRRLAEKAADDLDQGRTVTGDIAGGRHLALTPITLRENRVGSILATGAAPFEPEAIRHLQSASTVMALTVATERAVGEAELRARGELVSAVLLGQLDEDSLRRRARTAGVDLGSVRSVVVISPADGESAAAAQLGGRTAVDLGGWSADHAGQVVLLLREEQPETVRARIHALAPALPGVVGIAACAGGSAGVRTAYESARQTTVLLHGLDRDRACAVDSELGVFRSVFSHSGRGEVNAYVEATLGALVAHDRAHRRDLVPTLEAYLAQSRHHANTCAHLHVHANTLYARLDRITEVLGEDWKSPGRALDLQLALRLKRLEASVGSASEHQGSPD